jgi:hypothetical protein
VKPFVDEAKGPSIMDVRPGEVGFDVCARMFLDAKTFGIIEERTWIDLAMDLSRYCRDGRTLKRMVIKSHCMVPPK